MKGDGENTSTDILSEIPRNARHLLELQRQVYESLITDSISILKLNLVIITGYIALLGFIYDSISFDELGVAAFLAIGLVGWLLSSSMCVYAYWGSRRQTEKQADYYFNKSRPKKPECH